MSPGKDFDQFFKNGLNEILRAFEEERKKISLGGMMAYFLIGIALLLFAGGILASQPVAALACLIFAIPGIIMLIIFQNRRKIFVAGFKEKVILRLIKFIDPNLEYKPDQCISEKDYNNSGLYLTKAERFDGDDYIQGTRGKTFFCFSELHTEHEEGSGKNSHWETIFRGLFFIADFNKNFSGRTYVWSEENPQLGFFSTIFNSFSGGLEKVKLESIDFERRFTVYSTDQVEARYILTPSFMERLVKLEEIMGAETSFSFVDTNIYVAVPYTGDLFEPNIFNANDYSKVEKYYNTIQAVYTIIDELQLNQRLWSKQ